MLDPSSVVWAHGVNSLAALETALQSEVSFIESDLGLLIDGELFCAHVPNQVVSDLSFSTLLSSWSQCTRACGLKIDLKLACLVSHAAINAIQTSSAVSYPGPLWVNADVFGSGKKMNITELETFIGHVSGFSLGILGSDAFEEPEKLISEVKRFVKSYDFHVSLAMNVHEAAAHVAEVNEIVSSVQGSTVTLWKRKDERIEKNELTDLLEQLPKDIVYIDLYNCRVPE